MSSQGVMSGEQTNNSPGLCPIEGQMLSVTKLGEVQELRQKHTVYRLRIGKQKIKITLIEPYIIKDVPFSAY